MISDARLDMAIEALKSYDLVPERDDYNVLNIKNDLLHVWITARPHYCDRGMWQVNADSLDGRLLTIDWADGFPRYYFHTDTMAKEVSAFIETRMTNYWVKQQVELRQDQ